jgi:hypothetical protein
VCLPEEQSDAEETRRAVEAEGHKCLLLPGDLAEASFCHAVVDRTVQELGGLNILVNNAAHLNSQLDLSQLSFEGWDRSFKVNVYAYFHLVQAARPHLKAGDSIIATAWEEALKGSDTMIDYTASKAARSTDRRMYPARSRPCAGWQLGRSCSTVPRCWRAVDPDTVRGGNCRLTSLEARGAEPASYRRFHRARSRRATFARPVAGAFRVCGCGMYGAGRSPRRRGSPRG